MKYLLFSCLFAFSLSSTGQNTYSLDSFLSNEIELNKKVDSVFSTLSDTSIVGQLIMPAMGRYGSHKDSIDRYVEEGLIGGILLLNGNKNQFKEWTSAYDNFNKERKNLAFLYSADAEPSLVNRKIIGSKKVLRANEIKTIEQLNTTATIISKDLNTIGINYNFAPVVDVSSNRTVGYRGFGSNPKNIIPFSSEFIKVTQGHNIIATAKHFPGHGLVSGDTHESLQTIDGELKELSNYPPLIENGVLSIMIAHIAVKNNSEFTTNGLPSTLSKTIVSDLLRDSLDFQGLIVTDAMNMGGVAKIPQAEVKAIDAGCDIVLMPLNARTAHRNILKNYTSNNEYKRKVDLACKRIIRMKICLDLI